MNRQSRFLWVASLLVAACGSAFGQSSWTNVIPTSTVDIWGVPGNWTNQGGTNGVPGYNLYTGAGNSNDDAVVYFGTTATGGPGLDLRGTSYVLRSLYFSESTNANVSSDGNVFSIGAPASLTLESIEYFQGGRVLDFYSSVLFNDKLDGNAFVIRSTNGNAFDIGGAFTGSEGLRIDANQTMLIRNYQFTYGNDAAHGLVNEGGAGGTRSYGFFVSSNTTHDIPNFVVNNSGNFNTLFQRSAGTNELAVNINNLIFATNTTRFHMGGDALPDGTPAVTVNVNDQIDFSGASASSDRTLVLYSQYAGIVNFNSNLVVNQSLDAGKSIIFNGDGIVNVNADPIRAGYTNPVTMTHVLDGNKGLIIGVNGEGRLGQGAVDLRPGTVLQLNYDVFGDPNGFPGSSIRYGSTTNNFFYEFGVAQSGFYSPSVGLTNVPLEVHAFTGIAGNLSNAVYSGPGMNVIFQTNAIIGSGSQNMPTRADLGGAILWEGIRSVGGTYTNIGDDGSTSIFRGVAISALAPQGPGADLFSTSGTNVELETFLSGFHATLGSRSGQALEVLLPDTVLFTARTNGQMATFNSDTGVANVRGQGLMQLQMRGGVAPLAGSATNINRIGLDGTDAGGENPHRVNTQASVILDLVTDASLSNRVVRVIDGRVQVRSAGGIGGTTGSSNTTLIAGDGGTIWIDNATTQQSIDLNRGRLVFEAGGAFWTGNSDDRAGAAAGVINNTVFSNGAMLIVNDGSATNATFPGGYRDMSTTLYSHLITNMDIIFSDDAMRTALVQNATAFAIGDGHRLTTSGTEGGNVERIAAQAGGTNDTAILAARNSSNVFITAAGGQTFNIRPDVATTNATVTTFNDTGRFTSVTGDSTIRTNVAQTGTINLYGRTNRFTDVSVQGGTINITTNNMVTLARDLFVTNGATFNIQGTNAIGVNLGDATFRDILSYGTTKFEGNTSIVANVQSGGGAVRFYGAYNQASNLMAVTGGDIEFGNTSNDLGRIYGDVRVMDATNDSSAISFSQGDVRMFGSFYSDTVVNSNGLTGGAAFTPSLNLNANTNIITGSVIVGPTNGIDGGSMTLAIGNNDTDNTIIGGDLVLNTANARGNGTTISRGDLVVSNNIIVNASRVNYLNNTNAFINGVSGNSTLFWVQANNDTNFGDGIGLWDRLADGTLAMGSDGIVVRDYGQFLIDVSRTNKFADGWVVGQKVTIDNLGPNYKADGSANLWLRAQTNSINGGVGAGTPILAMTNVVMRDGSYLRVQADRVDPRLGLFVDGTSNGATAYLSARAANLYSNINLIDVQSTSNGVARTLQIGTTNGPLEFPLLSFLYGTASSDMTLDVFNGRLVMTNGASIMGTAEISRDGSVFEVATGTTGYVNQVLVQAGAFSNRGDVMTFNGVGISGGQAYLDGIQSYITNLSMSGGTGIVASTGLGLGQVAFDGGALRAATNYLLAADQGVTVTNGGGTIFVDAGKTLAVSNAIDGNGELAMGGPGTLILSNANTFTGGATVNDGTMLLAGNNRLATNGNITVAGGILDLGGNNQDNSADVIFQGGLTTNGTMTKYGNAYDGQGGTVAANLGGPAGLTKTGPGTLVLAASNSYAGATIVAGGSLRIDDANALPGGIGATGGASALILTNGGVLGIGIGQTFARDLGTAGDQVRWTGSGGFAAYGADRTVNIGGNTQSLTWGQTDFVSGDNELVFGAADSTHTLIFENSITLVGTNRFRANDGAAYVDGRLTGDIDGTGSFWKTGDGILELTGSNSWSGGTEVLGGQLLLTGPFSLSGNSLLTISNFGVVMLATNDFSRPLGTSGGDVQWTGSGGFAAVNGDRVVNLGGATGQVTWGSGSFVPEGVDGSVLVLGATNATSTVDFQNGIDLGSSNRNVLVGDGSASVDAILSGVLSGSGGLVKSGAGNLLLNNTSLFTGPLAIQDGRAILSGGDGRLATNVAVVLGDGTTSGVLQLGDASGKSDQTLTGLTTSGTGTGNRVVGGNASISALTLDIIGNTTNIYTGFLGGAGANENNLALNKAGDGILALTSANTYTGRTTVTGGVLAVDADNRLGGDPGSSITNQLTLDGGTFAAIATFGMNPNRGVTLGSGGGTIWVDPARFLTNVGGIYGAGGLTKTGNGVLILKTNSQYAGDTVVAGGVLRLDMANSVPGGIAATGGTSALTLTNGGVLGLGAGNFLRGLGTGDAQIQWTGDGGFSAYNASRFVILGAPTTNAVTWGSGSFVPDGNALILSSSDSTNTVTFVNPINLGQTNLLRTVQVNNGSQTTDGTISGIISGGAGLLKTGLGGLSLSGANTYTGQTVIANGILIIANENALGTNTSYVGDQLTLNGGTLYANATTLTIDDPNRGIYLGPSNGTFTSGTGQALTINNSIGGPGGFTNTTVTLRLNAANTYTGRTVITSGSVYVSNENALGTAPDSFTANQLVFNGGTLRVTNNVLFDDVNRGITNQAAATYDIDPNSSLLVSNLISGPGGVTKVGAGLLTLAGSNTYLGQTLVRVGTLAVGDEQSLGNNPAAFSATQLTISNGATFRAIDSFALNDPNRGVTLGNGGGTISVDANKTLIISNVVAGAGSLTKVGGGALILGAVTNTYAGTLGSNYAITTIAGGSLGIGGETRLGAFSNNALAVFTPNALTISNGGALRALASFTIDDPWRGIVIGAGGGGIEVDPGFTLTVSNAVVGNQNFTKSGGGQLTLNGVSNVFRNFSITNGNVYFNNEATDQTIINGSLVIDVVTNSSPPSYHRVLAGDFYVTNDIVINASGLRPGSANSSLFKVDANTNDYGIAGDGLGVAERLVNGTLAQGPNGVVVNDFARFELAMLQSNATYTIGQKITVATTGPNYSNNERTLDFRGDPVAPYTNGIVQFNVPNIVLRDGAHLRINEVNSSVRIGATLEGNGYLSEGSSANNADFDLLNVQSSIPGSVRTLYIGTIDEVTDTSFESTLFGTGSADITFDVFNGRLSMTNGAQILGTARVSHDGSVFEALGGTTGYVNQVLVQAGVFSNRGDVMAFSNINVTGGNAFLDGLQSYATNLSVGGGTAIVSSASLGLGKLNMGGGTLRAATNYVLDAALGTTLGAGGGIFAVDPGVTLLASNAIDGIGGLVKVGAGTMTLGGSAANTYTGLTLVSEGTLALNKTPGVNAIVGDGASSKVDPDILINGGTLLWLGSDQVDDTAMIAINAGGLMNLNGKRETIYEFVNSGGTYRSGRGGGLTVVDPIWTGGTNEIFGNDVYTNLDISGGVNTVHGDEGTGLGAGSITNGPGGLNFFGDNSPNLTLSADHTNAGSIVLAGDVSFGGSTGTATITSGPALVDDGNGNLSVHPDQSGLIAGFVDLNGAVRTFAISNGLSAVDMGVSANIVGGAGAGVNKTGAGTLLFSGTNSYLGQTLASAGTLLVNGDNSAATGQVNVRGGAALGGIGTVGGAAIFEAGSTNLPGFFGPGVETFAGGVTYSNAAVFQWELTANSVGLRGTGFDGVNVTNSELNVESGAIMSLVFSGQGSAVDWSDAFWDTDQQWLVFEMLGTGTTNAASAAFAIDSSYLDSLSVSLGAVHAGSIFFTSYDATGNMYLNYAIPEPGTWALLLCGLVVAGVLGRKRRP